ncbi:hypothetical protein [Roseateles saccharophilus]|uniref:hypothetical protein n=1 Tax=Roseateles saccharophilus TaxID=304 RepID=UPI00286B1CA3|nr:hypothetical protein [Roseateles saccharophilus]
MPSILKEKNHFVEVEIGSQVLHELLSGQEKLRGSGFRNVVALRGLKESTEVRKFARPSNR